MTLRMGGAAARARQAAGPLGPACEAYLGAPVPPTEPRAATGVYWGYTVRLARGLSGMIAGCPFQARPGWDGIGFGHPTAVRCLVLQRSCRRCCPLADTGVAAMSDVPHGVPSLRHTQGAWQAARF